MASKVMSGRPLQVQQSLQPINTTTALFCKSCFILPKYLNALFASCQHKISTKSPYYIRAAHNYDILKATWVHKQFF